MLGGEISKYIDAGFAEVNPTPTITLLIWWCSYEFPLAATGSKYGKHHHKTNLDEGNNESAIPFEKAKSLWRSWRSLSARRMLNYRGSII
jgi:hypothetical protein